MPWLQVRSATTEIRLPNFISDNMVVQQNMPIRISAMDRSGTEWKIFGDINFVNMHYQPFNAADWKTTPSGIEGLLQLNGSGVFPDTKP